uniref:hypothetical protein n=1 Tax=Helicobacter pylori TaxID=210 RepID=UPI0039EE30C9
HAVSGDEIKFSETEVPEIIEEKDSRFDQNSHYKDAKERGAASIYRFYQSFCDNTSAIVKKNGDKKTDVNKK